MASGSRFIHERMFLCQRLFHECLGYDLDRIAPDAKTCPGLIPESSGFIPYEDLPSFGVFQWLTLFHRYENRKLAAVPRKENSSANCQICTAFAKGGQQSFHHSFLFLSFPAATTYLTIQSRTLNKLTEFELENGSGQKVFFLTP